MSYTKDVRLCLSIQLSLSHHKIYHPRIKVFSIEETSLNIINTEQEKMNYCFTALPQEAETNLSSCRIKLLESNKTPQWSADGTHSGFL